MIPVIALVGRPNVGKSTLFNQFTKSRDALVADMPGLTRDRQYGQGQLEDKAFIVVDTGGIGVEEKDVDDLMSKQSTLAIEEADIVLFLVDARAGLNPLDNQIATQLRRINKPVCLVINKIDGLDEDLIGCDFFQLGFEKQVGIAASHGRGVKQLLTTVLAPFESQLDGSSHDDAGMKIAFIGRPNVGKSTMINRILGEERVVVYDMPGTTRDSISIPFERLDERYTLIDTAGVRRRGRIKETVEKFSIIKSIQAIKEANVCIVVVDATEGISDQDLHLIGYVLEAGRALIIAINKWDGLETSQREYIKSELTRRLSFAQFAKIRFTSALHGTGVGDLFKDIQSAYQSATKKFSTPQLTRILQDAISQHPPPMVNGRRIKLRYAHTGGHNPPIVVIHGNQTQSLPSSYKRYLINVYIKQLALEGTPLHLQLKSSDNPYQGRKNKLSTRQVKKKQRLMAFHKKKKKS